MYRIRRRPVPLSVTKPPPSRTTNRLVFLTFAVACILIVTGFGPHEKRMIPPARTAATTAPEVQLAGVPRPTTWFGCEVSKLRPAVGTDTATPPACDPRGVDHANGAVHSTNIRRPEAIDSRLRDDINHSVRAFCRVCYVSACRESPTARAEGRATAPGLSASRSLRAGRIARRAHGRIRPRRTRVLTAIAGSLPSSAARCARCGVRGSRSRSG
jgi:hypothetical protein